MSRVVVSQDVREMERRKRVEMIMNSRLFREELERIIETQMKDGGGPAGLLQQISDMMGVQGSRLHSGHMFKSERLPKCIYMFSTRVSVLSNSLYFHSFNDGRYN